jgi:hypothetical protein
MKYNERVSGGRSEMKISLTGILPRSAANNRRLPEKQSRKCLKTISIFLRRTLKNGKG